MNFFNIYSERMSFVKERKIKLSNFADAKRVVMAATGCNFDVDVFYNRVIVDAKSMLGVFSLDLSHILTVRFYGDDMQFESFLNEYAAA